MCKLDEAQAGLGEVASQVYKVVIDAGPEGVTCEEVEKKTGLRHQSASARLNELVAAGLAFERARRRKNSSGRSAIPYVAVTRG